MFWSLLTELFVAQCWITLVIAIVVVLATVPGVAHKWLWMQQFTYADMSWTLLSVKWGIPDSAGAECRVFGGTLASLMQP